MLAVFSVLVVAETSGWAGLDNIELRMRNFEYTPGDRDADLDEEGDPVFGDNLGTRWLPAENASGDEDAWESAYFRVNAGFLFGRSKMDPLLWLSAGAGLERTVHGAPAGDGAGDENNIRYITPRIAGFSLSSSWSGEEEDEDANEDTAYWNAAMRYTGGFGRFGGFNAGGGTHQIQFTPEFTRSDALTGDTDFSDFDRAVINSALGIQMMVTPEMDESGSVTVRIGFDAPADGEGVRRMIEIIPTDQWLSRFLESLKAVTPNDPQVQIETRFLPVSDNFLNDVGVDFRGLGDAPAEAKGGSTPGTHQDAGQTQTDAATPAATLGTGLAWRPMNDLRLQIDYTLSDLEANAKTDILRAPSVTTTSGNGITFSVTPNISADRRYITLELRPTIAALNENIPVGGTGAPSLTTRTVDTAVVLPSGETTVLGGLIQNTETQTESKVPLLGDIPVVGQAFRSEDDAQKKTELQVFVTPHIVRDSDR